MIRRNVSPPSSVYLRGFLRLLVTANVSSSPILVTLMMEVIRSSESSVLTRATRHNIPEDSILLFFQVGWLSWICWLVDHASVFIAELFGKPSRKKWQHFAPHIALVLFIPPLQPHFGKGSWCQPLENG
jgi:hypothetical protein